MAADPNDFAYVLNGEPFGALRGQSSTTSFEYVLNGEPLFALITAGAVIYTDTGTGIALMVGSGADAPEYADTGTGVLVAVGSGADAPEYTDTGTGVMLLFGGGADIAILIDSGVGVLIAIGSGTDDMPPVSIDAYTGDPAIYDLNSPTGSISGGIVVAPEQIYD